MAYKNTDMAEDLYSDRASSGAETAAKPQSKADDGAPTELLSKDFFPSDKPLKIGSTCTVRVEKITDGQVLVSYESSDKEYEDEEDEMMEPETSEMDDLMS